MDLFGIKEHDARHDEVEQQIRTLIEQQAQLTIELGEARADIARLQAEKLDTPDMEPTIDALDAGIADARVKLDAAKSASSSAWGDIYEQLQTSLRNVRDEVDAATPSTHEDTPDAS